MTQLSPGLLEQIGFIDDSYNRSELADKAYSELQTIAAEHENDDVHGRMPEAELVDKLEGLERI